ncbi:MAG: hypothetical protein DI601_02725 [Azospirillum brasilense]|nr:MAG: hypothetical protein DI601_02725 [Azospirillum brasilense]
MPSNLQDFRGMRVLLLLLPLLLAGCGGRGIGLTWEAAPAAASAASPNLPMPPARQADAIGAFVGQAQPGQQASLPLPDGGRVASVRVVRAYDAASGRPCREVQIGGAPGSRVYCQDPALGWVPTRPLLSGGTFGQL